MLEEEQTEAQQQAALDGLFGDSVDPVIQATVADTEADLTNRQNLAGRGGGGRNIGAAAAESGRVRDNLGVNYSADSGDLGPFETDLIDLFEDLDLSDPEAIAEAQANDIDLQPTAPPIPGPDRMPAKHRKTQLLSGEDIRSLAESGEYPSDLMGEDYFIDPNKPTESSLVYSQIQSPYEREAFLRDRIEYVLEDRKLSEKRREMLLQPATAWAAGGAVGLAGGLMAGASITGGVLGAIAKGVGPFATYLVEAGVPLAKLGGSSYIIKTLYNDIMSDSGITEEDAKRKIQEEVQKQLQLQKDSGSPPITGSPDTGLKDGRPGFTENPDKTTDF